MALRRDTNGVRHGREKAMRTTSPLTAPASSATILTRSSSMSAP